MPDGPLILRSQTILRCGPSEVLTIARITEHLQKASAVRCCQLQDLALSALSFRSGPLPLWLLSFTASVVGPWPRQNSVASTPQASESQVTQPDWIQTTLGQEPHTPLASRTCFPYVSLSLALSLSVSLSLCLSLCLSVSLSLCLSVSLSLCLSVSLSLCLSVSLSLCLSLSLSLCLTFIYTLCVYLHGCMHVRMYDMCACMDLCH